MAAPIQNIADFWSRLENTDAHYEALLGLPKGRLRLFRHRGIPHRHRYTIFRELAAPMGLTYEFFDALCETGTVKKAG